MIKQQMVARHGATSNQQHGRRCRAGGKHLNIRHGIMAP